MGSHDQTGDQEARDDVEDVDTDVAPGHQRRCEVEGKYGQDRDSAQSLNFPSPRCCRSGLSRGIRTSVRDDVLPPTYRPKPSRVPSGVDTVDCRPPHPAPGSIPIPEFSPSMVPYGVTTSLAVVCGLCRESRPRQT